ncbi:Hsp33 family molecular chaperone [Enterovibrio norvegicus FF-33]|uniref:33 kDa chaperonin n=1 Tax=Enterovibrio norvegicus FF-454 TaxID=1185651 RepID=A0A1E5CDB6_9GAMM|nr:Hsp33 family molecular chaperone HslO [Enterovibrio norvegicus]OEE63500.1 Hsp33 family molecular chaperone [Enterovibrio norvegicus FF-454]OEE71156.1 Hsp33 family molecular chaperone [Enterovibrio norvegicus FF-33]
MAQDSLHRYLFDGVSVRGELVQLSDTYQQLTSGKEYPAPVKKMLGELLVATSLLTATLKFEGSITVQIQGDGPVSLLVINGNHDQVMRGTARWQDELPESASLHDLVGKGQMVITIEPEKGERYQGIVGLEGETLEACLEDYFARSEQLKTRLWLRTGEFEGSAKAAGMLLQVLPGDENKEDDFDHLAQLTDTVKNEELFSLDAQDVLYRLYHQENVNVYEPKNVTFKCSCSRERSASAIAAIDRQEVEKMVAETGDIKLHCDYCGADYEFDSVDISAIFNQTGPSTGTVH